MTRETYHRDIGGAPYTLTRVPSSIDGPGWRVVAATALTDRFHRSHFVRVVGNVWRCTCPHHHYRNVDCKHITAVLALEKELRLAAV